MSIPADYRRVLEAGDPAHPDNPNPRLVLLYGPHLKGCLHVYTIDAMAEIEAGINRMKRGTREKDRVAKMILGKSWETEIDRDGRIVLPKERREQISLDEEDEVMMIALGDHFEIWKKSTYEQQEAAEMEAFLSEQDDDFDPLSMIDI